MKILTLILSIAALALPALGQDSISKMATNIVGANKPQPNYNPLSLASHALVDKNNQVRMNVWNGTVFIYPDATHVLQLPLATGTLATSGTTSTWTFEGATADAYETTLSAVDPTADGTIYIPDLGVGLADTNVSMVVSTINSGLNAPGLATSVWMGANSVVFEGATADTSELTIDVADVTADVTYRFPNAAAGTYSVMSSALATNAADIANSVWGISNGLNFEGATANAYETSVVPTDPTADRTQTLPDASGTFTLAQASTTTALTADDQAVTPGSNTRLQLTSDDATATNRTFTLSATGAITGQIYILIGPATNQCELADTGIQKLSATWSPTTSDTLTLLFDGTNFIELARADN